MADARETLARNLIKKMDESVSLRTQKALEAKSGVAQTTISYMRKPESDKSPTLRNIVAVARCFGLEAWELLIDPDEARGELMDKLFGPKPPPVVPAGEPALLRATKEHVLRKQKKVKKHA